MSRITGARPRAGMSQQRHLLPAGGGHDPLGQPLAHAGDDAGKPGRLVLPLGSEARTAQRGLHETGSSLNAAPGR